MDADDHDGVAQKPFPSSRGKVRLQELPPTLAQPPLGSLATRTTNRVHDVRKQPFRFKAQGMSNTNELNQVKTAGPTLELHDKRNRLAQSLRKLFLTDPGGYPSLLNDSNQDVVFSGSQGTDAFALHPTNLVDKRPTKVVGLQGGELKRRAFTALS